MKSQNNIDKLGRRRVVISGAGLATPVGHNLEQYWGGITSGSTAFKPISRVDASDLMFSLGAEVNDDNLVSSVVPTKFESVDRGLVLCRSATHRALADAGLSVPTDGTLNVGVFIGTGAGPTQAAEDAYLAFAKGGPRSLPPRTVPRLMFNSITAHVAIDFKLSGPQMSLASACSSANMAMSRSLDLIRLGRAKQVLTGGVEMPFCRTVLGAWSALRVCSNSKDPNACCMPFDRRRNGLVLAEGAALFVFEEMESALDRGAKIYAEVLGYGETNDATHMTRPDANSQSRAIVQAVDDAGLRLEQVDYVNAHGTATDLNDVCESQAIKNAFAAHASKIAVSSTKSVIGHSLGASGALELPAILGAFKHQTLPPTANLRESDPRCDLDYVPIEPRKSEVNFAISNSFAFGGSNSVLVLGRL